MGNDLATAALGPFAFSADGNTLAIVDAGGAIKLSDLPSGQPRSVLSSPFGDAVAGLIFSPDGQTLAGLDNHRLIVWDVAQGRVRVSLAHDEGQSFKGLVFSPDNALLAGIGQDTRITLWNTALGAVARVLGGQQQAAVHGVAFSPNGALLASAGQGTAGLTLWDVASGEVRAELPATAGVAFTAPVFSPDGKTLASFSQDARITLLDAQTGAVRLVLASQQQRLSSMAFSPDGAALASSGTSGQIDVWDVASGRTRLVIANYGGADVTSVVFSPDGKLLASVGADYRISLRDAGSGELRHVLVGHTGAIAKLAFGSGPQQILTSVGTDGQVIVWDVASGMERLALQIPMFASTAASLPIGGANNAATQGATPSLGADPAPTVSSKASNVSGLAGVSAKSKKKAPRNWKGVTALDISPNGALYGVAGQDGKVRIWTPNGKERWATTGHHGAAVSGVAFSADGKRLFTGGRDSEFRVWDEKDGTLGQVLLAHEHPLRSVAASPDGRWLASAGEETRIMLWDAKTGKLNKILSGSTDFINAVSFSPDSKYLAAGGADALILFWDVEKGQRTLTLRGHAGEVNALDFSPGGAVLASGGADSQVILWDVATGGLIQVFAGHQAPLRSVAFNHNGKSLASAGEDGRILVWDTATRQLAKQMTGATSAINALKFTKPQGKNLIAGDEDGELTEWDVEKGQKGLRVTPPLEPQSNNSEALPLAGWLDPGPTLPERSSQSSHLNAAFWAKEVLPRLLDRVLHWLVPAAEAAIPPPPGGPILVVTRVADPFSQYYAEILRTEGLNEFAVTDISSVTGPAALAAYDLVILAAMPLTSAQVTTFTNWVNGGGNLIATRPDKQLAGLLGLTDTGATLANGYLLVDTSQAPGNGIVNQTIQFHDTADRYTLNGASSLATLYSNAITATANPAVTLRTVGSGQVAAFTYDLARSIVYTRQGNPAWAGQERDGFAPRRSDDMFYGNATADPQPDWVDLNKVAIPQADEQQRLLANLIIHMNLAKKPLPRFWYFPSGKKAVVIMTGDDHANNGTAGRFDQFIAASPAGCSVTNWECVRGTSYIFPNTPLTNAQAASYNTAGFEVGLHVNTNCADFTPASLGNFYSSQISTWAAKYTSIPAPITQRHHCIAWSDWVTGAKVQLDHGIRLDTSYYFWPPGWVDDVPGMFTGSAMPMRFADLDGTLIDVYHAATQMTDESGQGYPYTVDTLLDRAVGAPGYYGAYTINAHTDVAHIPESNAVLASAPARGVPIITSKQMLDWLDFRDSSSFGSLAWSGNSLSFTLVPGAGSEKVPANGLQGLLPVRSGDGLLSSLTLNGNPVTVVNQNIKGVDYATFTGVAGSYVASYTADNTPPTVISTLPANGATGVSQGVGVTATFSEAMDAATITGITFELRNPVNAVVPAALSYNASTRTATLTPSSGLSPATVYTATVKGGAADPRVKDLAGNALAADAAWSFTTGAAPTGCAAGTTLWPTNPTPAVVSDSDTAAVELGVKFRPTVNGTLCGIRFYKGASNTGTHVGKLWSSTGTLLASATFTGETASGWQQVDFATPVSVTAGTTYVASYYAPVGRYSANLNYFTTGVTSGSLYAFSNAEISGGNGVYRYGSGGGFPSSSYQATNYWVDVVFSTGAAPTLQSMTVTPANPSITTGATQQFTATGTYSDASTQNLTSQVTWSSSNAAVAMIGATTGLATAVSPGNSTISAALNGITGSTGLTVQAVPLAITTATALPGATLNATYTATLTANGGLPPYTWSIISGSLPDGLTLNPNSGAITGTPTVAGAFGVTVQVSDSNNSESGNATATKVLNLTVSTANPIVTENSLSGNPSSEWDVSGAGDSSIQGFATDISVNKGGTVNFKLSTPALAYRLDIYRMGYYGGSGARKVATINGTGPQNRAGSNPTACQTESATGLIDCGNWTVSSSWTVPVNAVSGIYFAKAVRTDTGGASHIVFIVRDDASTSDILFQTSDTTWQAYNTYGGNSFYAGSPAGRAYKVSYNRPFTTRAVDNGQDWLFNSEYPMVRWLEANGYDVSYTTGVDSDRRGNLIPNHKVFLSVGHDEYWSGQQRANVETARNAGVHMAFFSGNEVFWKTRWENSIDGAGTAYRTLVCYKETHANAKIDPLPNVWTGTWRDPRFSPPADGGNPENTLTGTLFMANDVGTPFAIAVPEADGKLRFWRHTSIATLGSGQTATLPIGTLGYEWDSDVDNGARPAGLIRMSTTTITFGGLLQDYGSTYGSGTLSHYLTLYKHSSGARVFGAGTIQWPWGLDSNHDRGNTAPDARMQQATVNLFADMGVQPSTLQSGLVAATASTDVTPPASVITTPAAGSSITLGSAVTINGTANDSGGVVGGVEVSVDGGATWHPATGRGSWSYSWTPSATGAVTLKSRAVDDSGNLETPGTGISLTVVSGGSSSCTGTTLWPTNPTPAVVSNSDTAAVELGVKFRPTVNGTLCGIRFYKGANNTGTHVGKLWSSTGTLLASVTFTGETASGWQQVDFATPVSVTAGTTYVASYYAPVGRYSANLNYFTTGVTSGSLYAFSNAEISGGNGVYRYGSGGGFPSSSYQATNYWVDVVFNPGAAALVIGTATLPNATVGSAYTATLTATGGTTPYNWSLSSGTLPAGLSLNASTGVISGTPTAAGTFNVTVQVTDAAMPTAQTATQALSLTVSSAALAIGTATLPNATVGTAYTATLTATGGTTPYNWSLSSGTLPAGLSLNASTGVISGTPTAAGTFNVTVQVTDATAQTASQALSIAVAAAVTNTGFLAPAANAAITSNSGDNNGFETTPANAYVSDGVFAVDTNSGTNTNTSCTNAGKDRHSYYDYGFTLPATPSPTILGIEVQLTAMVSSTTGSPKMCVQLSWNGGSSWTAAQSTPTLGTANATYVLGGAGNTWGRAWTVSNFSNANFRVRITDVAASTARTFSLDSVAVRVTYQ